MAAKDILEETAPVLEVADEIEKVRKNYGNIAALVLGGGVVGAGIAWFVADKVLSKKYEAKFDAELESSMEFLASRVSKPVINQTIASPPEVEEPLEAVEGERIIPEKPPLEEVSEDTPRTNYHKIIPSSYRDDEEEDEKPVLEEDVPTADPMISVISRDIYQENTSGWEQVTLQYFKDGGVLDMDGDFVENHELLIGPGMPAFGQMSEDKAIVYIRNKRIQSEYEVIWDPANASEFLAHSLADLYKPNQT